MKVSPLKPLHRLNYKHSYIYTFLNKCPMATSRHSGGQVYILLVRTDNRQVIKKDELQVIFIKKEWLMWGRMRGMVGQGDHRGGFLGRLTGGHRKVAAEPATQTAGRGARPPPPRLCSGSVWGDSALHLLHLPAMASRLLSRMRSPCHQCCQLIRRQLYFFPPNLFILVVLFWLCKEMKYDFEKRVISMKINCSGMGKFFKRQLSKFLLSN